MVDLLARATELPVQFAKHNARLKPDTIYIAPVNSDVTLDKNQLKLSVPANPLGPKPSINLLLTSLAENFGDHAIGVILSGTGSDGAQGVKAIKSVGGVNIVQKPETAKFDSMPRAAIATGAVDIELPPQQIADALRKLCNPDEKIHSDKKTNKKPLDLHDIIALIRDQADYDFSLYKEPTLRRQIERRMALRGLHTIEVYGVYLQQHPEELNALLHAFLIGVTGFMRDPDTFNALRPYLRSLIEEKHDTQELRVWVAGCATGEEAYTLAMLIDEELGDRASQFTVRIFATDINEEAIAHARRGEYGKEAVNDLPEKWHYRYFHQENGRFRVIERLRKQILFSRHDLTRDPPFVRIDLISCRNLLIYFKPALQEKVLKLFHDAATPHGLLLLGNSESIRALDTLWVALDSKHRIYRRREGVNTLPVLATHAVTISDVRSKTTARSENERDYTVEAARQQLMSLYLPPSVLVTPEGSLLHLFGDCSPFLKLPRGRAKLDLFSLVEAPLRAELRAGIHIALRDGEYRSAPFSLNEGEQKSWHRLIIRRFNAAMSEPDELLLISFEPFSPLNSTENETHKQAQDANAQQRIMELEEELQLTRERMQTVIEELETANEELQALNEEAQAASEELQATNEELETANEELQASNEELVTLNEELEHRSAELERSNRDLANILESLEAAVLVMDDHLVVWRHNKAAEALFSFGPEAHPTLPGLEPRFPMPGLLDAAQKVLHQKKPQTLELASPEGRVYLLRLTPYRCDTKENEPEQAGVVLHIADVTRIKKAEQRLTVYEQVFNSALEGMVVLDIDFRKIAVNPAYSEILGYKAEEVLGRRISHLFHAPTESALEDATIWCTVKEQGAWRGELMARSKNGEQRILLATIASLRDAQDNLSGYVIVFTDITEQKKAVEQITHQAYYDQLTDLPNRVLLKDRVNQAIRLARRHDSQFALLFLDLDNFKLINDSMGHQVGDQVLIETAKRLQATIRESDTVSRLSGDEFVILLNDTAGQSLGTVAQKIIDAVTQPLSLHDQTLRVTASVGIAQFPMDGDDFNTLLKHADAAMYAAKQAGKNSYHFFTTELQQQAARILWLDNALARALAQNQLCVAYQPIVEADSGKAVYVEALMRWRHPERGEISPAEFIPVAENNGMIKPMSLWLTDQAIQTIEAYNSAHNASLGLSLNLSLAQLTDEAHMQALMARLQKSRLLAQGKLSLEITESMAVLDKDKLINQLDKLRDLGCKIALDDFGTGYSSLSVLKSLPVDAVKIDASFVRDIGKDPSDETMIRAIIEIAGTFGLQVIVEGVETQTQLDFVTQQGASLIQGYYFSRPLSAEGLMDFPPCGSDT